MNPTDILTKAAELGPAVFMAVIAVGAMAWLLNTYDKRRTEEVHRVRQDHRLERAEWRKTVEKINLDNLETSNRIVDKMNEILIQSIRNSGISDHK